jgi:PAS domain S-box-containing protein
MPKALVDFFNSDNFMPHGHCFLWQPDILWMHVVSDFAIGLSYFAIPWILIYFVRKRRDLPFKSVFLLFGAFILLCGSTHFMNIWVLWHPDYALEGVIKVLTAVASFSTLVVIAKLMPYALRLVNPASGLLAAIVESSEDAIVSRTLQGAISSWNKGAERIFGYSAAEAIGQPMSFILPKEGEEEERQRLTKINAGQHVATAETIRVTKDGRRIWGLLSVSPIRNAHNEIIGSSRIFRDIGPSKEAEKSLALLAAIVESSQEAIISKTLNDVITSWNKGAARLFGYSPEEAIGRHGSLIIPQDKREEERHMIERILQGQQIEHTETIRLHKNGTPVPVSIVISPIFDKHGQIIGISKIARDITEEREGEKAREQLRQAQKMEAIGQLTGGIAHDFNNLLAVILGNLDFLNERTKEGDPLRDFIKPSIKAAEHGAELTQQLLAFGRKQALQPKIMSINELLHYFTALIRHTLGERIQIILSLAPDIWYVSVDAGQLQNALLNLAVNARDAMPDGGKLILETKNIILDEQYAAANADVTPGEYVMVAVSDTGEGMSQETMEKAFEPFFTTKNVGKGSGLGLSMVYGFVKQSAGHIKIYSEFGHGTSIKIYLPRAEGVLPSFESKKEDNAPPVAERKAKLILVVEDNKEVLRLTSSIVESLGYKVLLAETGDAAMKILATRSDIDLLLTDVMLPGDLNGPVLAKRAVQLHPKLKVLFNSGYAEHAILQRGILEEGVHLISKPFRKQQIAEKIAEVLAQ